MNKNHASCLLLICAALLTACAPPDSDAGVPLEVSPPSTLTQNGLSTNEAAVPPGSNGLGFNGLGFNGLEPNGLFPNGAAFNHTVVTGIDKRGITIDGAQLLGPGMSGADFIGTHVTAHLVNGRTAELRIDGAAPSADDPDFWLYELSFQRGNVRESACGHDHSGAPIPAIALEGRWDLSSGTATGGDFIADPDQFTFACVDAVLAKCALAGYKPWEVVEECDGDGDCHVLPLRDFHQACTRMLRADYCGDGQSHTVNGFPVNLWDNFGIQTRADTGAPWAQGAEWSPDGAVCIEELRYDPGGTVESYVAAHCPERRSAAFSCFGSESTFFTGTGYAAPLSQRSLLRNEHDPDHLDRP